MRRRGQSGTPIAIAVAYCIAGIVITCALTVRALIIKGIL